MAKNSEMSFSDEVMLMMFCDLNGLVLKHYQEYGEGFSSEKYCA
jgi:hypothetical protein